MSFLNKKAPKQQPDSTLEIGDGLKRKLAERSNKPKVDKNKLTDISREQGYDRSVSTETIAQPMYPKLGRPRINEDMVYWRIYLRPELRANLEDLRQNDGHRRLNDLLEEMLDAYMDRKRPDALD